jgi:hypothetical protein
MVLTASFELSPVIGFLVTVISGFKVLPNPVGPTRPPLT